MDKKLEQYRYIIIELLRADYAVPIRSNKVYQELDKQLVIDTENDHYQILTVGWQNSKRIYSIFFHIDIKDGKVWVQEDNTDSDIVGKMEEQGIPASDIVLAFHSPIKRPLTGYAVG